MRRAMRLGALLVALLALGCEGLGRELVDELPEGELDSDCRLPTVCAPLDPRVEPIRGLLPSPAVSFPCSDPSLRAHVGVQSTASLTCLRWELPIEGEVTLPSVRATNVELVITATQPARVTFEGAQLSATRIELRGPVTLRFVAASALVDVHVIDASSATPSLTLIESEARGFVVSGDDDTFDGALIATRSRLTLAKLLVYDLTLENTLIHQSEIAAERLVAHNIQGADLRFQLERGALASAECSRVRFERCGTLQISSSLLEEVWFAPCREPLRIDRTNITGGAAAGPIESKLTAWRRMMFAGGLETDLEAWLGTISESAFCGGTTRVASSARTRCNDCAVVANAPQLMCQAGPSGEAPEEEEEEMFNPGCPALDALQACTPMPVDEFPF